MAILITIINGGIKVIRSTKRNKKLSVDLDFLPTDKGLAIKITKNGVTQDLPLKLTLSEYRSLNCPEAFYLIDELWYDEKLVSIGDQLILPFDELYNLTDEERNILGFETPPIKLDLEIDNHSFVGSNRFKIIPKYSHKNYFQIQTLGNRIGPIIEYDGKKLLIDKQQYKIIEMIDHQPAPKDENLFSFIAKLKNKAEKQNIPLSRHLKNEDYVFIEDFDFNIEKKSKQLLFNTFYKDERLKPEVMGKINKSNGGYAKIDNKRVFVDPKIRKQKEAIANIGTLTGDEIPRFIENPELFLPEEIPISLEWFSERVKSLGLRVYKAQPYVHAKGQDRGWFDIETGFHITDDEGEIIHDFKPEELEKQIENARKKGQEFIEWNNQYIKIPDEAHNFIHSSKQLKNEISQHGKIDLLKLPYVLEIFENFDKLEYNEPIFELKQSMADKKILEEMPPAIFNAKLKPFQTDGFIWLKTLNFRRLGGLLADDMGLGKTIQVIAYLSYAFEQEILQPSLIVVPKTLMENWYKEIKKFSPRLADLVYFHIGFDRVRDVNFLKSKVIVITTYQTLTKDQLVLGQIDWHAVILDEAQNIKNPTTASSVVAKALKARFRLALTGTPVENSLTELWSIIDFVQPGLLGSLKNFKQNYINPLKKQEKNVKEIETKLIQHLNVHYKRRTKDNELKEQLPGKYIKRIKVPMGTIQERLYRKVLMDVKGNRIKKIQAIGLMKRIASHPGLVSGQFMNLKVKEIPKLQETIKIIREIKNRDEKVLIFTEYLKMQQILREHILNEFGIFCPIINGETQRRQREVDLFNQGNGFNCMILSPKAAGVGLTITSANHVIHYTRWWNPAIENQATDRVYRIGQEKDVYIYYPIVTINGGRSVEVIVDEIITDKQYLANSIVVPSKDLDIENEILNALVFN
jgi:SNF2 family DNA or RNA helicase